MGLKKLNDNATIEELREFYVDAIKEYEELENSNKQLLERNKSLEESNHRLFLKATTGKKEEEEEEQEEEWKSELLSEDDLKSLTDNEIKLLKELEDELNG